MRDSTSPSAHGGGGKKTIIGIRGQEGKNRTLRGGEEARERSVWVRGYTVRSSQKGES